MIPPPKKQTSSLETEDEDDIWRDLPPPGAPDVEEEWVRGDDAQGRSGRGTVDAVKQDGREPMGGLSAREWDRWEMDKGAGEEGPGLPDARLLMDDLRVDGDEGGTLKMEGEFISQKPASFGWVVYAGLTVVLVLIGALIYMTVLSEKNPTVNPLGIQPLVIEKEEVYPRGELIADLLARQDEARRLFQEFAQARTSADVLALVRKTPGLEALVEGSPEGMNVPKGWKVPKDARWEVHTDVDPVFGVLVGYGPDDEKFQAFLVMEGGSLRLDWEATVRHSTLPFSGLVAGQGDASKVRLWVEPATFYPANFPEKEYRSFKIHTKLEDPPVWAFARRSTLPEQELSDIFHKSMFGGESTKSAMVLLSLTRGPADSAPNQWLITDVLHKTWVVP